MATRKAIPVVRERLRVTTRKVETGTVRVHKTADSQPVDVDEPLVSEDVTVERVPIGREAQHAEPIRQEGDTTIVNVYEERLVLVKQLILKEEIRLTRRKTERRERQTVELRGEHVSIDRAGPDAAAGGPRKERNEQKQQNERNEQD